MPARRRDDDDDDDDFDDRPRRRKRRPAGTPTWVWVVIGGVVLLPLLGVVAGVMLIGALNEIDPVAPPGYTSIRDKKGGYRVFLPGAATLMQVRPGNQPMPAGGDITGASAHGGNGPTALNAMVVAVQRPGFAPPTDPEALAKELDESGSAMAGLPRKYKVTERTPTTLGGRPAMKLTIEEVPDLWGERGNPEFWAKKDKEEKERVAKEGVRGVVVIAANGPWRLTLSLMQKGKPLDPAVADTVLGSFQFQ